MKPLATGAEMLSIASYSAWVVEQPLLGNCKWMLMFNKSYFQLFWLDNENFK